MSLLDYIFTKKCLECGREGSYVCRRCILKISIPKPICPECKKPSIDGFTHIKCQKKYGPDGLITFWNYEGVIRKALIALKYKYARETVSDLKCYLSEELDKRKYLWGSHYVLIPVPLYWYKENARGFNQSFVLAGIIAEKMNWKIATDVLIRKRSALAQVSLKGAERKENIKGVFSLEPHLSPPGQNNSYILFDDTMTTGSTLKEATKVLKLGGAGKVWQMTIARK